MEHYIVLRHELPAENNNGKRETIASIVTQGSGMEAGELAGGK
jgi:hypothetical protein